MHLSQHCDVGYLKFTDNTKIFWLDPLCCFAFLFLFFFFEAGFHFVPKAGLTLVKTPNWPQTFYPPAFCPQNARIPSMHSHTQLELAFLTLNYDV
jgi:hypothetical protein